MLQMAVLYQDYFIRFLGMEPYMEAGLSGLRCHSAESLRIKVPGWLSRQRYISHPGTLIRRRPVAL